MEDFITNILVGVRRWVNGKLEEITYVISSHINELTGRMETVESKLDGVETGAEVNVLEGVKVNGTDLTIDANKKVNVTIAEGSTNGAISVNGTDVSVHGLGSAAYTASTDYATAAQGNTADSAIQSISAEDNSVTVSAKGTGTTQTVAVKLSADTDNAISLESDGLKVVVPAATVTGVKTGEKIIGLDGTELTSTLSIAIEKQSNVDYIVLKGKNNEEVSKVDASAFVKDGVLSAAAFYRYHAATVEPEAAAYWEHVSGDTITIAAGAYPSAVDGHEYIVLSWNADSPTTNKLTFIDALGLVDDYTAGTGISIANRVVSLNAATASTIGGVKPGDNVTVANDGTLTVSYATTSVAGAIKVGTGLSIDNSGVLSADPQAYASTSTYGVVKIGDNISVADGVISVGYTSYLTYGVVRVGSGLAVADGVISILAPTVEQVIAVLDAPEPSQDDASESNS